MLTHTFCAVPFCFGLWAVCTVPVPVPTFKALYVTWHSCYYLFIFQLLLKIIRVVNCNVQLFRRPVAADDGVTPCTPVCAKVAAGKKSEVVLKKKRCQKETRYLVLGFISSSVVCSICHCCLQVVEMNFEAMEPKICSTNLVSWTFCLLQRNLEKIRDNQTSLSLLSNGLLIFALPK